MNTYFIQKKVILLLATICFICLNCSRKKERDSNTYYVVIFMYYSHLYLYTYIFIVVVVCFVFTSILIVSTTAAAAAVACFHDYFNNLLFIRGLVCNHVYYTYGIFGLLALTIIRSYSLRFLSIF